MKDFYLLEEAALRGERCPKTSPYGPLNAESIRYLINENKIRSEVYHNNYRVVQILEGPAQGKSTQGFPNSERKPFRINGKFIRAKAN